MATRNVLKPFKLNTTDGVIDFEAGTQEIDDELVDHWFVKAHLEQLKDATNSESEDDEKKRLIAELAAKGINVGGNIKLETLRDRVAKANTTA
ncbi:STY1053 family phage-associated protein [Pseudomonas chlororaphis]|uniref:STY1053 family phage-associated protein n=1 Tax=Pseudomonas chlororaphis TaxID=587753 RepID=UPI0015DFBB48|nr:hypothetical protein [Pseudomonas chlororaphis]QLL11708.1 hypothetical protein H0I86_22140 [Pseudomonas chlororaphis subsp. aurantiaca]